jgi:hypothetical protein
VREDAFDAVSYREGPQLTLMSLPAERPLVRRSRPARARWSMGQWPDNGRLRNVSKARAEPSRDTLACYVRRAPDDDQELRPVDRVSADPPGRGVLH